MGPCDRFGAPLDLELAKDFLIVSFHRFQGEEQPLANLLIREPLSDEAHNFEFASAQRLEQGLGRGDLRYRSFVPLLLNFTGCQYLPTIVRHQPLRRGGSQERRHRASFIDKKPDQALWLGQRERVQEELHRLVLVAICLECDRLEYQRFEPFIRPPFGLHLPSPGNERRPSTSGISLRQEDAGLAKWEVMRLCQMRSCRQLALTQERQDLCGSDFRETLREALLVRGLTGLRQHGGCACHIALGQFQTGKKHLTRNESVNTALILPRQVEALSPMLLGGLQVVPLIEYTGQAKMCFVDHRPRHITCQLQDAMVGRSRPMELIFCLLDRAQAGCSCYGEEDVPRRLAERNRFGIGLAGGSSISLQEVGIPQYTVSDRAEKQVLGVQVLQGAARLGQHGFYLELIRRQDGPAGGNLSDQVLGRVIGLGALQGSFGNAQFLFDTGRLADNQ